MIQSYSTLLVAFLALLKNPRCQRKAQDEIDRVVGTDRLPDFSDRDSLPYVECLMLECMRWHPVVSLGTICA